jgi:hypothetical protein
MARTRLRTAIDVRRYLATVIRRLETGAFRPKIAGRLAYIANILLRAIEAELVEGLEERVAELEKLQGCGDR